jgi:hypothetical protein
MKRHSAVTVDLQTYADITRMASAWSTVTGFRISRTDVVRMGLTLLARELHMRKDANDMSGSEKRALVEAMLEGSNSDALFLDGHDDAIIGVAERCGQPDLVVYDRDEIVKGLVKHDMTESEAEEFLEFNIAGAWCGEHTPLIMHRVRKED